jgi:Cu(I)/Ag(I) efflux system membrane fusion protein
MAVVRWVLVALMGLTATGSLLSHFGVSPGLARSSPRGGGDAGGARLYYCPMHPQIVQDRPGDCPICNMRLVPKPEGPLKASPTMQPSARETPAPGASAAPVPGLVPVDIPIERVQKIGVRTDKVVRRSMVSELRTVGTVEASERGLATISPRFSGWIEELRASETGQRVRRGDTLATIYSPEVLQAQQELLTALGWSAGSQDSPQSPAPPHHGNGTPLEGLATDARRRLELLGIAGQEIEALVKSRKPQRAIAIRSPVSGHVIGKTAVAGMAVSPGTPLYQIADLSRVWVLADVYESDIRRVRVGQAARFFVSAYPDESFPAKVRFVYPTVNVGSRTMKIRLEITNRPGPDGLRLRPGMYGSVLLELPPPQGLMVPAEAVVDTGEVQYLFVAKEGGRFEPRRVKLGVRANDRIEIAEGVAEGETVVTTANFLIDSESRLRAAIEGQTAKTAKAKAATPHTGH